jgi:hypothetical protein
MKFGARKRFGLWLRKSYASEQNVTHMENW